MAVRRDPRGGSGASSSAPAAAAPLLSNNPEGASHESTGTHPTADPLPFHAEVVPLRPAEGTPEVRSKDAGSQSSVGDGGEPTEADRNAPDPPAARSGIREPDPSALPSSPHPPVLASESLREDIEPTEPWRRTLRVGGPTLAATGAIATVALGGVHAEVFAVAALLVASGAACLLRVSYAWRAWSVLAASGTTLAVATVVRSLAGAPAEAPVLAPATVVLAAGLLFRSAYRASHLARTVVAAGMLAVAIALVLADAVGEFSQVGTSWQSWLHVGSAVGFGLLLLVSLLAFMAASTTGGTMLWAACLLLWHAVAMGVTTLRLAYPEAGGPPPISLPHPMAGLSAAAAAAAALAALALAQALAAYAGGTSEQRRRGTRGRGGERSGASSTSSGPP